MELPEADLERAGVGNVDYRFVAEEPPGAATARPGTSRSHAMRCRRLVGLALAAACPGPLAYQLGIYCGYIRFGIVGGLAVAIAFGLPPFVIVNT